MKLDSRTQTLASFDWQWAHLPTGDFMPGDPWFDANATRVLANEMCGIAPTWFAGRRVLDAGCGRGRWTRALLELGAHVTAVDYSDAGLAQTRALCGPTPNLVTSRVDLLNPPPELRSQRFDLVFSYGVLHHTGDTWKALANVSSLVAEGGALFLYLYGVGSWSAAKEKELASVREELAPMAFEAKIAELRRRFPADDPHQLFDLMSPLINDRLEFEAVADRLRRAGFARVDRTVDSSEIYARSTRPGFPGAFLLKPAAGNDTIAAEISRRHAQRLGAAFEDSLRVALAQVDSAQRGMPLDGGLRGVVWGESILDASLPPDALSSSVVEGRLVRRWEGPSPATPGMQAYPASTVVHLGASLGACRFPEACLSNLWTHVAPGGSLAVEVVADGFSQAGRSWLDRVVDARAGVPHKLARLLRRNPGWCSGEGLFALGGRVLLNPLGAEQAVAVLQDLGATDVRRSPTGRGTELVVGRRRSPS
jgi:SAM-dependent methyltransferase